MYKAEAERVLDEPPMTKFGSHELLSPIGTGTGYSPVPVSDPFVVLVVGLGGVSLADF